MRRGANEYSLDGKTCVAMDNCVTVKDHTKAECVESNHTKKWCVVCDIGPDCAAVDDPTVKMCTLCNSGFGLVDGPENCVQCLPGEPVCAQCAVKYGVNEDGTCGECGSRLHLHG